eukprot:scaffold161752_cov32-Tisochrysis_lutea.AAC.5
MAKRTLLALPPPPLLQQCCCLLAGTPPPTPYAPTPPLRLLVLRAACPAPSQSHVLATSLADAAARVTCAPPSANDTASTAATAEAT